MLKRKEVAEMLGVHEKTVYFWIKQGYINAVRIGRNYKVEENEVKYIKENGLRKK